MRVAIIRKLVTNLAFLNVTHTVFAILVVCSVTSSTLFTLSCLLAVAHSSCIDANFLYNITCCWCQYFCALINLVACSYVHLSKRFAAAALSVLSFCLRDFFVAELRPVLSFSFLYFTVFIFALLSCFLARLALSYRAFVTLPFSQQYVYILFYYVACAEPVCYFKRKTVASACIYTSSCILRY